MSYLVHNQILQRFRFVKHDILDTALIDQRVESDGVVDIDHIQQAEVIRQAVERYIEDFDDLSVAIDRLRDPGDPVLDWDGVWRGSVLAL